MKIRLGDISRKDEYATVSAGSGGVRCSIEVKYIGYLQDFTQKGKGYVQILPT